MTENFNSLVVISITRVKKNEPRSERGEEKYKYKELHTDENTYKKIKELALLTKSHMTTVVRQSVDIYYNMIKKPRTKGNMPDINKIAWYIF